MELYLLTITDEERLRARSAYLDRTLPQADKGLTVSGTGGICGALRIVERVGQSPFPWD